MDRIETREAGKPPTEKSDLRSSKDVLEQVVHFAALAPRPEPLDYHPLTNMYRAIPGKKRFMEKLGELVRSLGTSQADYKNPSDDLLKRIAELALPAASDVNATVHTFLTRTDAYP